MTKRVPIIPWLVKIVHANDVHAVAVHGVFIRHHRYASDLILALVLITSRARRVASTTTRILLLVIPKTRFVILHVTTIATSSAPLARRRSVFIVVVLRPHLDGRPRAIESSWLAFLPRMQITSNSS